MFQPFRWLVGWKLLHFAGLVFHHLRATKDLRILLPSSAINKNDVINIKVLTNSACDGAA